MEKKLESFWRFFKAALAVMMVRLLSHRHGKEVADHWVWGMTPFPFGQPVPHQYVLAVRMIFANTAGVWAIAKAYDDQMYREYLKCKEREGWDNW